MLGQRLVIGGAIFGALGLCGSLLLSTAPPSAAGAAGDAQSIALDLVTHIDDGTLYSYSPPVLEQIRDVAAGTASTDCLIDSRTLQLVSVALANFKSVGVSSLNRKCGGISNDPASSHVLGGGGLAVDFYALEGTALTGADGYSIRLIGLLDPLVQPGARIGQSYCRAFANVSLALVNIDQFNDSCNHLHVDLAYT